MVKSSKWIQGAIKKPGSFSAVADRAGKSTRQFAEEHKRDSGKLGKRARLAETLMGMNKSGGKEKASRGERWYGKKD